jgi:hypothetical protein
VFGKLFHWYKAKVDQDGPADEPATAQSSVPPPRSPVKVIPRENSAKGFDPYNSGAFKRQNAWERVPRR